jgi:hypothetical protein
VTTTPPTNTPATLTGPDPATAVAVILAEGEILRMQAQILIRSQTNRHVTGRDVSPLGDRR